MKLLVTVPVIIAAAVATWQPASAENGRNAAVIGGLAAGALLGTALARPAAPPPVVYDEPVEYAPPPRCHVREEPLFDRYGNVVETRRVRTCR